jgi:activating signal cointegrator complex subunit 1
MGKRRVGGGRPTGQKKPPLTHFLCVPLVTPESRPQLEASLKLFKDQVSPPAPEANQAIEKAEGNDSKDGDVVLPYVHSRSIRPVGTLHCTLGVMSLDQEKLTEAISLLQSIDIHAMFKTTTEQSKGASEASFTTHDSTSGKLASLEKPITPPTLDRPDRPFKVELKGLVSMHSAKSTSILYSSPADETGRLLPFCIALQNMFKDKGFIVDDRPLKLHATIVNTIYVKGRKGQSKGNAWASNQEPKAQGHGPNANAPLKIDATPILEKYEDFVWAKDVMLDRVAICEMGAKKILDETGNVRDEEYTEVANFALPT